MLLQHRITTASIINLKSINAKDGKYRVRSGEHTFSNSEAITKIKVFELGGYDLSDIINILIV